MSYYSRPYTLTSGATITLEPWSYKTFGACYADLRAVLKAFRERASDSPSQEEDLQLLLDRVLLAAVPRAEDRDQVLGPDLADLLGAIFDLNRVDEVAAKPLSLYQRLLQAELSTLETPPPPSTGSS
ncbi:hypothetical protein [Deinococcus multiflagellatus]|uniref:Uncharacterized protein n=1 Tax=Deinococcus multiflagellatus TaxID=1656887 RepID=A0ABW1ZRL7_9DEIO|nr:hypothetical protein [Deinococcus multiflagellatus]MBZ9715491.1 hypothetical protein [Deinococcus multiflagellatus]